MNTSPSHKKIYSEDIKDKLSEAIKAEDPRSPHDMMREFVATAGGINFSVPPR